MSHNEPPENRPSVEELRKEPEPVLKMVVWFFEVYEDPVENCPHDEGDFVYIWGGPYLPWDELEAQFPESNEQHIARAAEIIDRYGTGWSKKPPNDPEATREVREVSVQPEWCRKLPIQQQSVLFLAGRGPDGVAKIHPCKEVHIAYRGSVFVAAKYGRPLRWGERADSFMSLDVFADEVRWDAAVVAFFDHHDELAKHYIAHLMHGAQILGYKHPDPRFRERWADFYMDCVRMLHVNHETEVEMDRRLGDWGREHWEES